MEHFIDNARLYQDLLAKAGQKQKASLLRLIASDWSIRGI